MNHLTKLAILTIFGSVIGSGFYFQYLRNKVAGPVLAQTDQTKLEEKILTTQDFDVFGRDVRLRNNPTMRVRINPELTPLTITIDSYVEPTVGAIKIYGDDGVTLIQQIELNDPNMRLADRIHENFNVADINFDGYADIGVLVDGGVKWGAFQYWTFDKNINQFVSTTFTDEFRKLNFNNLILDSKTKQIQINNFCGTLICDTDLYQITGTELHLIEERHQEQTYSPANDGTPLKECVETITLHNEQATRTQEIITSDFCPGYY